MLKHNLRIIFRNFISNKNSFFINLIGLSTALACTLLIYLWINDELNVDKFHENDSQLYQVMQNFKLSNDVDTWTYTPALLREALMTEMPEIEKAVTINSRYSAPSGILTFDDKNLEADGIYSSEDFFNVFSYQLLQGDANQILKNKYGIVISEDLALKLFKSTENIIGKTIQGDQNLFNENFQVTGVYKNVPLNSTKKFDFILNFKILEQQEWVNKWQADPAETYLVLKEGTNIALFNKKIAGFLRSKTPSREPSTLFLQQYSKRYLYGTYENGKQIGGRIVYVKLFSMVAVFILLLACINFMNLSTAKAFTKLKEIGVKKVIGATRKILIVQYFEEAVLTVVVSFIVAFLIIALLIPVFNQITGKHLVLYFNLKSVAFFLVMIFVISIIAGGYPVLHLSGLKMANIFQRKTPNSNSEIWIRKGLVVFQFTMSVIFIIGFIIINRQLKLIHNENLGYSRENVVCFKWKAPIDNNLESFLSKLQDIPGVESATNMTGNIISDIYIASGYSWKGDKSDKDYAFKNIQVGYDFMKTLDIDLIEGRAFSKDFNDNSSKIIINEAAMKMMALSNPVNTKIEYGNEGNFRQIIGVTKNFHYGSLYERLQPLVISFAPWGRNIMIKINSAAMETTIGRIKQLYTTFNPDIPYEFRFLDDNYQAFYESENKVASLSKYFTFLAIIISCLGLYGLVTFTAQRRKKEIGIRKINGSTEFGIISLLSGDFGKMVIVAIFIGLPIGYLVAQKWLENFAYRTPLSWWIFALAGLLALGIALLTVSFQSWKAATRNPVEALRYE